MSVPEFLQDPVSVAALFVVLVAGVAFVGYVALKGRS